ncbi:hypothetical protein GO755_03020 [Spirosoma sp. HMF4905]|uniref:Ankyrin repeat domain-containing protein n=1 Tax=Spirosoma arboris TaxID=2682092 RepID=A0A7K1S584_9BACT|nr:hypothetical protein [Spirosoma arboris]MVM28991.1 hypothetical protein [Spirosoma arboris]
MKAITIANWSFLIIYGILLTYSSLTLNQSGTDAAGRGMAAGYLFVGFILLVILIGVNCLPFQLSRIIVFVLGLLPIVVGLIHWMGQTSMSRQTRQNDDGKANGTYYFHDPQRRQLAQAIADHDIEQVKMLLQQPIPQLNESGSDYITLLDFAALKGVYSQDSLWVIPCLSLLLAKGAAIETADSSHIPTHTRVSRNSSAVLMDWFLKNGANPNAKGLLQLPTPILFIVMEYDYDREEKIKLLLAHGADPNSVYPPTASSWLAGHSALLAATRLELWDVCRLLLEKGADATVVGPQHQRFADLIKRSAEIYTERNNTPETFTALLKTMSASAGK